VPQDSLHQDFLTILMFLVFGALFVVLNMVAIGRLIRSRTKYTEAKSTAYECGEPTFGSAFVRFDIRFYVLALVFAIFDVEVVFLFPWAVVMKDLGPVAYWEAFVFVAILSLGLAYVWRKGDIAWAPFHAHQKDALRRLDAARGGADAGDPRIPSSLEPAAAGADAR
jgi:NADH-quinone oxidoreductase subunit A